MTKQEVNEIISSKAAEYGFEIEENSMGWNNKRTGQDYINKAASKSKPAQASAGWGEALSRRNF